MDKPTPGPWATDGLLIYADHGIQLHVAAAVDEAGHPYAGDAAEANARLIAAAPDHALICWAMCVAAGRWEPYGDGRGEFCINGLRYSTRLDEFGCPVVNSAIRAAISKATGDATNA